jgi:UDP-2,3-diacylglucosamine hydrolase
MAAKPILFISDLHLETDRSDISQAFFSFLESHARQASTLYILGDFFNVWLGDDDRSPLIEKVTAALHALSDQSLSIFLMHGNRDFLIGEDFASRCGATLIQEPYVLEAFDERYLLMHGDVLCTKDVDYMAFRNLVRQQTWQADFLQKPLAERQAFAAHARQQSKAMSSNKAEDIMDVTEEAVMQTMLDHGVGYLIHGHTHRPAVHKFILEGQPAFRYVLSDWEGRIQYVRLDESGLSLLTP